MSRIYDIDYRKLVLLLLPTFLRQNKMTAWLFCLVAPINTLYNQFLAEREEDIYKLEHTPQVCSLQKMLNDKLDATERRIRIGEVIQGEAFYIYSVEENNIKYIQNGEIFLNGYSGTSANGNEFTVYLPFEIWDREKTEIDLGIYRFYRIEALLDFYKLAGKNYKIVLNV